MRKPLGGLGQSMSATSKEVNSFKTASGEIIPDGGECTKYGYLENGEQCYIGGRFASVHKPLVSASRMGKKGFLMLFDGHGGNVICGDGVLGKKIRQLVKDEFAWNPAENVIPLYLEDGVYNFYVQDENWKWQKYNVDTGAAETVHPMNTMEINDNQEPPWMRIAMKKEAEGTASGGPRRAPWL